MTNLNELNAKLEKLIDSVGACEYTSSFAEDRRLHRTIVTLKKDILSYVDGAPVLPEDHIARCFTLLASRLTPAQFRDVLAAWRGPDGFDGEYATELDAVKTRTTAVIRRAVLETVSGGVQGIRKGLDGYCYYAGLQVAAKSGTSIRITRREYNRNYHFFFHIKAAAKALDVEAEVVDELVVKEGYGV